MNCNIARLIRVSLVWIALAIGLSVTALAQMPGVDGATTLQSTPSKSGPLDSLRGLLGIRKASQELLPPEQALDIVVCVSCKEMEQFTFSDERVQARLKDTLLLRADVTANNMDDQALLRRFKLFGPPGIEFFDRTGDEVALRVIGYQNAEQFLASLARVDALGAEP